MKTFLISLLTSLLPIFLLAQNGTLRGTVYDDGTGEPILFGNVVVTGTGTGTTTDLDGAYSLALAPGSYSITFSYLGYSDLIINEVEIKAGEVTSLDARIQEESEVLNEVVISAKVSRNTETALATIKRRSTNVLDGISAASFRKIGDSNAASAIKRVSGVSIEGGKYVYVRGLGDRYTKSILNGVDIPGLDPDRNTLQMDIFPTNVIDNIIVLKSFTADLPADFTGGVVNITTKDFPEAKTLNVSASLGYNPDMHLNDQYLDYGGSGTDFLGFDDGQRDIPTDRSSDIPTQVDVFRNANSQTRFTQILNGFDPTLAGMRTSSFMDYSLGLSTGNQINKGGITYGYNLALTYKNSTDFYENAEYSLYGKGNTSDIIELEKREQQIGDFGENNVLLGGLAGLSMKTKQSKINLNILRLQNGERRAALFDFNQSNQGSNFLAQQHNLEYSERTITNFLLNGSHTLGETGTWNIDWKLSPTFSNITDPDIRFTRIRIEDGRTSIGTESGIPQRIWRFLNEKNLAGKADITKDYTYKDVKSKLKFGGGYTYKQRDYEINNFGIFVGRTEVTENPNTLFNPDNFFSLENTTGLYYQPNWLPVNVNQFDANTTTIAGYVSNEFTPFDKLKTVIGVRLESFNQKYTGVNQSGAQFDNQEVIDELNFFPTLNLIYSATENSNLRLSATQTIARPSFKEASFATIIDPLSGRTFIGGFFPDIDVATGEEIWDGNLRSTNIINLDLRYEYFQTGGQNISLSAFYKAFENPIEIIQYVQAANNFQPRNVGNGQVLGLELEFRKRLGNDNNLLSRLTVNGNVTVTQSEIEMSETEFLSRQRNARDGEEINDTRDMAGQAPYLVNAGLSYAADNGLELGFYYNVQGRTLQFVGIADRPDIYTVPFHSLNFSSNYNLGDRDQYRISLKADNILRSKRESVFESFNAQDQIFTSLAPQTTFSASIAYRFF
jgi:TonB-dependent receptor